MGKKFLTATEGRENSLPDCRLRGQIPDCRRQLEADLRVPIRNRPVILQYAKSEFLNTDLAMLDALAIPGLKIETGGTRHPAKVDKKFLTGTEGVEESTSGLPVALPGPACSRKSTLHYITYLGSISDLAEMPSFRVRNGAIGLQSSVQDAGNTPEAEKVARSRFVESDPQQPNRDSGGCAAVAFSVGFSCACEESVPLDGCDRFSQSAVPSPPCFTRSRVR